MGRYEDVVMAISSFSLKNSFEVRLTIFIVDVLRPESADFRPLWLYYNRQASKGEVANGKWQVANGKLVFLTVVQKSKFFQRFRLLPRAKAKAKI